MSRRIIRLQRLHGLSEAQARILAELAFGAGVDD